MGTAPSRSTGPAPGGDALGRPRGAIIRQPACGDGVVRAGARPGYRPARSDRRAGQIDIIFLVERLESVVANGKRLPLTNNVVVDQVAALDLIDQLRVAVPEEVRSAKRINSEGERIIEQAQQEAERVIGRAQEQAAFLIEERGLTQAAEEESRRIVERAEGDAEEVRRGADEYAAAVLIGLEGDIVKTLQTIKKGIALLDERRAALRADRATDGAEDDGYDDASAEDTREAEARASRSVRT